MTRTRWFLPDKKPICDALVVCKDGTFIWRSWDSAAPGWWERLVEEKGIKKWRKIFKTK